MTRYEVRAFDALFDPAEEFATYFDLSQARAFAEEIGPHYPHVFITCEHGHNAHCPHNCHNDAPTGGRQMTTQTTTEPREYGTWTSPMSGHQPFTVEPADDDYPFGPEYRKITLQNGIECHDHVSNIERHIRYGRWQRVATALVAALALLAAALPASAQPAGHDWHAPAPYACEEVGHFDDGTVIAVCGDGDKVIAFDPDGQTHPDFPYRAPGTWHALNA